MLRTQQCDKYKGGIHRIQINLKVGSFQLLFKKKHLHFNKANQLMIMIFICKFCSFLNYFKSHVTLKLKFHKLTKNKNYS